MSSASVTIFLTAEFQNILHLYLYRKSIKFIDRFVTIWLVYSTTRNLAHYTFVLILTVRWFEQNRGRGPLVVIFHDAVSSLRFLLTLKVNLKFIFYTFSVFRPPVPLYNDGVFVHRPFCRGNDLRSLYISARPLPYFHFRFCVSFGWNQHWGCFVCTLEGESAVFLCKR